jgi:chromosome segregation ATPase
LAFCFVLASLSAYKEEERIRELTVQVEKVHAQWKADLIRLQADVDDRDARLTQVAAALRGEAEKLVKLKAESALALNRLASKIEAAEKDASSWRDRYQQRPDNCKAAVELLDTACPGVKGY